MRDYFLMSLATAGDQEEQREDSKDNRRPGPPDVPPGSLDHEPRPFLTASADALWAALTCLKTFRAALPSAWSGFMETSTTGTSCLGPLAGLQAQQKLYQETVRALADARRTTIVLVTRPEPSALREACRTSIELRQLGCRPPASGCQWRPGIGRIERSSCLGDAGQVPQFTSPACHRNLPCCRAQPYRCWRPRCWGSGRCVDLAKASCSISTLPHQLPAGRFYPRVWVR